MNALLFVHSLFRWLVLLFLLLSIYKGINGLLKRRTFSRLDNALRHWTATVGHVQLLIGMIIWFKSPTAQILFGNFKNASQSSETLFLGLIHPVLMFIAIVLLTIGSALAKRQKSDYDKYKTMTIWFVLVLIIILISIPWPFSPFASRDFIRTL